MSDADPCDEIEVGDTVVFKDNVGVLAGFDAIVVEVHKEHQDLVLVISLFNRPVKLHPIRCSEVEKRD